MSTQPVTASDQPTVVVIEHDGSDRPPMWADLAPTHAVVFVPVAEALERLRSVSAALVIVDDTRGRDLDAFSLRDELAAGGVTAPMALMVAAGDEDAAVEALRRGFVDYLIKREDRLNSDLLRSRIDTNLEMARLKAENERLQRAIEESQARLFNVYDSLDDVIMQIDHECRVVSMNRSAAALANIEPRDGVGQACWQLFDFYPCEERARKDECPIYRTFLEGETIRGERVDPQSKAVTQYMTFITTLKGEDYTVYRETDITEKRRLEERIAAALRSLGASTDEQGGG